MPWELDDAQREAVESTDPAIMVVAGPGTGKTRVLTARAAHLTENLDVDPARILAITYTNRAAAEMRERLVSRDGSPAGEVMVATFHAWAYRLVRKYFDVLEYPREPVVFDEESTEQLLRRLLSQKRIPEEVISIRHLKQLLDRVKAQVAFPIRDQRFDPEFQEEVTDLLKSYQEELRIRAALDFSDILLEALRLLYCFPDVRNEVTGSVDHLLIDEFQDINPAQYRLVDIMQRPGMSLFAVGDEDQTIYTFRGSCSEFIDQFVSDFHAELIPLGLSYRCSDALLYAAGTLISENRRYYQRVPEPPDDIRKKPPLGIFELEDEDEEAKLVAKLVRSWVESGADYRDIAVLYRVHNLANECERVLLDLGIPVLRLSPELRRKGTPNDPLPFLRLAVLDTEWDWDRALGLPRDRLGELDDLRLRLTAMQEDVRLDRLIARPSKFKHFSLLGRAQIRRLNGFVRSLKNDVRKEAPSALLNRAAAHLVETRSPWRPSEDKWLEGEEDYLTGFNRLAPDAILEEWQKSENGIRIFHAPTISALVSAKLLERACMELIGVKAETRVLSYTIENSTDFTPDNRPVAAIGLNIGPQKYYPEDVLLPRALYITDEGITDAPPDEPVRDECFALALSTHRLIAELAGYRPGGAPGEDIVFFDLETTGTDIFRCEIVELAAIRIHLKGGEARELGHFHSLVKPSRPIPASASEIHGINDADVAGADPIDEVLPRFLDFIGDSPLAGHNIDSFDLPIVRRFAGALLKKVIPNLSLDTLPFSRRLYPGEPHRLAVLAEKFGIDTGDAHRALDDVRTNIGVFNRLIEIDEGSRARGFAPHVPLALALAHAIDPLTDTDPTFIRSAAVRQIAGFAGDPEKHPFVKLILESVGKSVQGRISGLVRSLARQEFILDETESEFVSRLNYLRTEALKLEDDRPDVMLPEYLAHIALLTDGDFESEDDAVRMMTLHAAKGLEFDRVIILGLEQGHLPHYLSMNKTVAEIEEERRLCYVGITRARHRAALIFARRRFGRWRPQSMFLGEIPKNAYKRYKTKDRVAGK